MEMCAFSVHVACIPSHCAVVSASAGHCAMVHWSPTVGHGAHSTAQVCHTSTDYELLGLRHAAALPIQGM